MVDKQMSIQYEKRKENCHYVHLLRLYQHISAILAQSIAKKVDDLAALKGSFTSHFRKTDPPDPRK